MQSTAGVWAGPTEMGACYTLRIPLWTCRHSAARAGIAGEHSLAWPAGN